jgi:hypothetical protein
MSVDVYVDIYVDIHKTKKREEKILRFKDRVNVINYASENQLKRLKGTLYYKKTAILIS